MLFIFLGKFYALILRYNLFETDVQCFSALKIHRLILCICGKNWANPE
jgi:hypothetical protein